MEVDQSDVAQVQVRFKTRLERHRVTEKPFAVPVNLNRRGLSQVINHLLEYSTFHMFRPPLCGTSAREFLK